MKSFIALCLRRPVGVGAACALVVVLAAVAYVRLPVALLPEIGYPALSVWTAYPDVPPERVERAVTEPVEQAVSGATGLQRITARSQLGGSLVELRFGWNADLDLALLDLREQLARLGEALPREATRPVVLRLDPSERPVLMVALRGAVDTAAARGASDLAPAALVDLGRVAREVVARRLEQLRDVARVRVTGGYERQVDVRVDADRMASYGVGLPEIGQALQAANVALPGGVVRRGPFRYAVEVSGEFERVDDVAEAVVARAGTVPVRLRDVAEVTMGVEERYGLVRLDGREAVLLLVERTPEANTVRAAEQVRDALYQLNAELPGVRLDVVVDESRFIEDAIGSVTQAVLLGGLLAVLVLLVFLRRPRALLAVAVAVPLSLAITLVLFELFGVSFNLIALSGLALGVGMLVDNAIVVVENIARLREAGAEPRVAARRGAQEVAGAITASTLTTIAVFLPLTFVEGLAGRLFRDQSVAVVCSLLASLVVALAVVPLVAAGDRRLGTGPAATGTQAGGAWGRLLAAYERALAWCLDRRGLVLGLCALLLAGAGLLAWHLPREVVPETDRGHVEMHLALPPSASLPLVSRRAAALEEAARQTGLARHVLADVGERGEARLELDPRPPYEGTLTLVLPEGMGTEEAVARARALPRPADVEVDVRPAQTQLEALLVSTEADLFVDLVSDRRAEAEAVAGALLEALRTQPALADVRRAEAERVPAYQVTFRRDAMARLGVDAATVAAYLEAAARGRRATELRTVSDEVPVVLQARAIASVEELLAQRVPARDGLLPLRTFVDVAPADLPAALLRTGQAPVVRLEADVAPGSDLAAAEAAVEEAFAAVLPAGVRGTVGGATEAFRRSLRAVGWSLLLSLALVYLILAAQFERLLQPLVVLGAVPLAAAGVALVLWAAGQTVNLMSLTGCVVLVGIVVNDAIVKVDFINQRRAEGRGVREAVVAAGRERVRPILMTTVTTVLGLLPLALGVGAGAELRAPLAVAIVGGLLSATVLTLLVVPVLYTLVATVSHARPDEM